MLHTFGQNCWWKWQICEWLEPAMPAASCTWRWSAPQNSSLRCSWRCLRIRETGAVLRTPVTLLAVISFHCPALLTLVCSSFVLFWFLRRGWVFVCFCLFIWGCWGQLHTRGWKRPFNAGTCDYCNLFFGPLMWMLWQLNSENTNRPVSFTSTCVVTSSHASLLGSYGRLIEVAENKLASKLKQLLLIWSWQFCLVLPHFAGHKWQFNAMKCLVFMVVSIVTITIMI